MQSADPIGESTDGQVGAQTSNRLSVPRSPTRLSFVKMRRSTIRPIPVSAAWKVPDDLAQTRIALGRIEYAPLLASCLEGSGVDQNKSRNGGDRALVLPAVGYTAHDNDFTLLHGYDLSAVELDIDLA
jgi:hypothetical protein